MKPTIRAGALSLLALLIAAVGPLQRVAGETPHQRTPSVSSVSASGAAATPADACSRLAGLTLKDVTIVAATGLPEGAPVPATGLMPMFGKTQTVAKGLPAFCRIAGHIRPEPGSDIGFEVWLPAAGWNGRLQGIGIGGFAGGIDYFTLGLVLKGGAAGMATDTGHSGTMQESGWARGNPQRVRDYAWRAVHLSTLAAKRLVAGFYGRGPDKSYFVGCSGGGRQGLMEAGRFPDDYDGVLAGAPAASFTALTMAMLNPIQAQLAPGAAIRADQVKLLQAEVLEQCDGADGQLDGLVADPRQCRFDAARLACGTSASPQCFSAAQLAALRRIYAGPRDGAGRQLAGAYLPSGSEAGDPAPLLGWEGYLLGDAKHASGARGLVDGFLGDLIQQPFATAAGFDWDKDPAKLRAAERDTDAPADLRRFFARGGKLILWHGWADAAIPPQNTLDYYDAMLRASGARARGSTRLFTVPGVQHCFGGKGPDAFGQSAAEPGADPERSMVAALQGWAEGRRAAPETLIGRRGHGGAMGAPAPGGPERQRLLCAMPKKAVLKPGGDPDSAADYSCV